MNNNKKKNLRAQSLVFHLLTKLLIFHEKQVIIKIPCNSDSTPIFPGTSGEALFFSEPDLGLACVNSSSETNQKPLKEIRV